MTPPAMFNRLPVVRLPVVAAAAVALLLGACASEPPVPQRTQLPPPPTVQQPSVEELRAAREATLSKITTWKLKGKVAYRLPEDAGSASLDWQQDGDQSRLRLSGPLGVGSTQISNEGALLRVRRDGIDRLYPADGAPWLPNGALLPIPMDSIQFWLRGLADPALSIESSEAEGVTPELIQQAGWVVRYEEFRDQQGLAMPSRMVLEAPGGELTLRVILRAWDLD